MDRMNEADPTRQPLLARLRDASDEDSWRDFFETYWRLIYRTAVGAGLSDAEAQDVVQETVISVFRKMPGFEYDPSRGSFRGWLLTLTRWRITDQLRRRKGNRETSLSKDDREERFAEELEDPAVGAFWDAEWEKNLLEVAIERTKARVKPKHFQLFDLHVRREVPAGTVAKRLGVSISNVYHAKLRVGAVVKSELKRLQHQEF